MKKYKLEIEQDDDPMNPRTEWDNLGTMICFHKRYDLGDKTHYKSDMFDNWKDMKEKLMDTEDIHTILPLYLYDHSGITISTSPFGCNFDSGQIGFIFISNDKVKEEGLDETKVEEYLKGEVKTYDQYITGDVYQYRLYEVETCSLGCEHENLIESCGGYYGEEHCREEGESMLKSYEEEKEVV